MKKLLAAILILSTAICGATACNKTADPSTTPSVSPSVQASVAESVVPSVEPSVEESVVPSVEPSVEESVIPSVEPSVEESVIPSVEPSVEESVAPSVEPSVEESVGPSVEPSVEESVAPSVEPSIEESVAPSVEPSVEESVTPSVKPSEEPSITPSVEPSVTPSVECEHNFLQKEVLSAGDCLFPAKVLYECEFCKETEERTHPNVGAQYHSLTFVEETQSTCKVQGNRAYYECATCMRYFIDEACTQELYKPEAVYPLAPHTPVYYAQKESTCEEQGNIAHYACSVCERYFREEECKTEIFASDVFLRLSEVHPLETTYTYNVNGHWFKYACKHEGKTASSPHQYGVWEVTVQATVDAEGEEKRTCVCGYFQTRKTEKLPPEVVITPSVIPSPDLPDEPMEQTLLNLPFTRDETFTWGGWQRRTVHELYGSVSATNDGTGSMHMYLSEEGRQLHNSFTQWLSTSFNVTEGKKYVVSLAYRVKNPGVGSGAQIIDGVSKKNEMDDVSSYIAHFNIQWHTLQADVWHRSSLEFTATETATYYLIFKMYGLSKYSEYWIDEVKIMEYAVDEPYYKVENGNSVTLSFLYPDGTGETLDCIAGDTVDFPMPKAIAGQAFVGWYTSSTYARRVYVPQTNGNRRYFAKYMPAINITFHLENGQPNIVHPIAKGNYCGDLHRPEREGYVFAGYFTEANEPYSAYRKYMADQHFYARWIEEEQAAEFMDNFGFLDEIPTMVINTEGGVGITSKYDYINATLIIQSELNADWNVTTTTEIRGRGNSSWWCMEKASYRLKLTDKKTNVLGMTGERNYALISNHADKSQIRNLLAYAFGADEAYHQGWEPEFHYVYLTVNGDFRGLYMLIETIRASKDRINLAGTPNSVLDTGYLLEQVPYNRMLDELKLFPEEPFIHVANTYYWNVKYPEREDFATQEEWDAVLEYITNEMNIAMGALYRGDRYEYLQYIDEDSFIDYWLMQDLFSNFDCTQASVFVYKAAGGLITAGPLWDFDIGVNNISYVDRSPNGWYGLQVNAAGAGLMKSPQAAKKVYERIVELYEGDWQLYLYSVWACMDELEEAWNINYERWNYNEKVFETPSWILALPSREAQYDFIFTWLAEKMNFLYRESVAKLATM